MRSRTELVTTTFDDSEDDFSESEESEEDWRPNKSKNRASRSGGRTAAKKNKKRGCSGAAGSKSGSKRRKYKSSEDEEDTDDDDDFYEQYYEHAVAPSPTPVVDATGKPTEETVPPLIISALVRLTNRPDKNGIFEVFLYKKDIGDDYKNNTHLCLWRKDGVNLLQKYIRIKTGNPEEFIFTSSSVYSSWDEERNDEFESISVQCLKENNRRVTLVDLNDLHNLAQSIISAKETIPGDGDQDKGSNGDDADEKEEKNQVSQEDENYDDELIGKGNESDQEDGGGDDTEVDDEEDGHDDQDDGEGSYRDENVEDSQDDDDGSNGNENIHDA